MDKTKLKLAAFFDNDEDEPSFPQKKVDTSKMSQFATGSARKSRREKEQEAAEAKKKEEAEFAQQTFQEFMESFGDGPTKTSKSSGFVKAGESVPAYAPFPRGETTSSRSTSNYDVHSTSQPSAPAPKPKGKRAMDAFLEEIKREQAEREAKYSRYGGRSITAMAAYDGQSGSRDRGDPETSNVFVANLPQNVSEQSLGHFFAKVGPVGSVKIMWPRTDGTVGPGADMTATRKHKNAGLSGFVSFMKRKDAEAALREFDGLDWGGSVLRVGWSKAVPMAAKPMYVVSGNRGRHDDSRSPSPARSRSGSHSRTRHSRHSRSWSRSRSRSRSRSPAGHRAHGRRKYSHSRSRSPRRRDRSPIDAGRRTPEEEAVTETFIRAVAAEVKGHGVKYESSLKERELNNPKYSFLTNRRNRRHALYKGLVESTRTQAPEFDDDGYNSVYSTDSAEESEREHTRKIALGKLARKRFEAMLRAMSGRRGELARCMAFSLEHAEAASEVSEIIIASLLVDSTPVPRKMARLHLICDILHNSAASVPSAWRFRQEFQSRLGIVFDHLANIYHSFPGRITAETFKKQITSVVDVWEDWIVFPPEFTSELRQRLEGAAIEETPLDVAESTVDTPQEDTAFTSRFKPSTFQPAAPVEVPVQESDGEPMDQGSDVDGEPVDVDGEPIPEEDVDGIPLDDVDGAPIDDVDRAPMDDDDLDGVPLESGGAEDVDGMAY
ncbi:U2 snRNP-associated SURP motif-containing protein [Pleurotus pulmonarius]